MRTLYIGDIPSHSVRNASYDFDDMQCRLGLRFQQVSMEDLEKTINEVADGEAEQVARRWSESADALDERERKDLLSMQKYT